MQGGAGPTHAACEEQAAVEAAEPVESLRVEVCGGDVSGLRAPGDGLAGPVTLGDVEAPAGQDHEAQAGAGAELHGLTAGGVALDEGHALCATQLVDAPDVLEQFGFRPVSAKEPCHCHSSLSVSCSSSPASCWSLSGGTSLSGSAPSASGAPGSSPSSPLASVSSVAGC